MPCPTERDNTHITADMQDLDMKTFFQDVLPIGIIENGLYRLDT